MKYKVRKTIHRLIGLFCAVALFMAILPFSTPVNAAKSDNATVIVSLGDSYASGEGVEAFYGQDLPLSEKVLNEDWLAHRSQNSWSGMLKLPSVNGPMKENRNQNWYFAAVSGAKTSDICKSPDWLKELSYDYYARNSAAAKDDGIMVKEYYKITSLTATHLPFISPAITGKKTVSFQLDIFEELEKKNQKADYVTVSIGGNDAGFADIIFKMATGSLFWDIQGLTKKAETVKKDMQPGGVLYNDIKDAYKRIEEAAGKQATIMVAGYPKLFDPKGSLVFLSEAEVKLVNEATADFNKKLEQLIDTCQDEGMDIHFVSTETAFETHGAYADTPYINKIILGAKEEDISDLSLTSAYSVHPNEKGVEAYRDCIQKAIDAIDSGSVEDEEPDAVLSPESAADIYLANSHVWMRDEEYSPMQGWGYCLLDLDFDGILELINSENDGSGRYSYNRFYRINLEQQTVEEFFPERSQDDGGIDYYSMSQSSKLLKNNTTGAMFYCFDEYLRVSSDEGVTSHWKVYMKDGRIYEDMLSREYWHPDYDNNSGDRIREYTFQNKKLSATEYEQKTKAFYAENKDVNLVWTCISGYKFDNSDNHTQKQLLLDAYRSFSYDGFSFDTVPTYDITIENNQKPQANTETAVQYSMADYDGMTIDDVAKLWGYDYVVLDGLIGGGWGAIYYPDDRCPFVFCFSSTDIVSSCSGDELLSGIIAYPQSQDDQFYAVDNVKLTCSYEEVSQKLPGEAYWNAMDDGQSYQCELKNDMVLTFTWTDVNGLPLEVIVSFHVSSDSTGDY